MLATKIHVPVRRRGLVARPRLSERLDRGTQSALTLVSASAGFGKTTLLTQWLTSAASGGRSAAWLSLDQRDNDPALFWAHVVAALQATSPGVGAGALALLQPPQAPIDVVLATLLNELDTVTDDVVLVLDDYHVIDAREVQDAMAFLLEHLPAHVHLVITSRADPALPLARLRARGELVEIRAADLRFTPDEAAAYLDDVMGLTLTAHDVAALEERTEGWIAALQLAALSLQGRQDGAAFIAGFAGNDRHVVDYLVEEVLQRQSEDVRSFLLETSILHRLSGPLCDAVTGRADGRVMLEALDRRNLFLVQLDDRRRWYRYQHLFSDMLAAHLLDEQPDRLRELHLRASGWYERNDEMSEAIHHALAAEDFARAAGLVELAVPAMGRHRREATLLHWLEALPDEVVRRRPVLSVGYAGALLLVGRLDGVEARLADAERWLGTGDATDPSPGGQMIVVDDEELRRLPRTIEMYRAAQALARGDVAGSVQHARRALELAAPDDHLGRASASGLLGLASWSDGDLVAAHRSYTECMTGLRRADHVADTFGCAIALADIRRTQGRLGEAMRTYERTLQLAFQEGGSVLRGTADMYVGMSEVQRERGDLPAAEQHLQASQELGDHLGLPQNRYRWRVASARVRQAHGDLAGALGLLDEAERVYVGDYFPDVRPVAAMRARVLVAQGAWGDAAAWVRERGLSVDDDLSYLREFEHVTLARVLLAQHASAGSLDDATRLLERLLRAAQEGERAGSVLEILVLQALAHQAQGDVPGALAVLDRALTAAEPEGYVRVFVDEGPPMVALLRAAAKRGIARGYVHRLLAAVDRADGPVTAPQALVAPLSARELDVLRLLGTDLDGPDIARELVVSLSTVRTHTKNIFAKLGVNNRRAAVRRAAELGLASRGR